MKLKHLRLNREVKVSTVVTFMASIREQVEEAYDIRSGCGFTDGNGCSTGSIDKGTLFGGKKKKTLTLPSEAF